MKRDKILILCFVLLVILLMGSANAAENITDNIQQQTDGVEVSVDDNVEIQSETIENDDAILSNESPTQTNDIDQDKIASEINVTFEEQMWKENLSCIKVDLPENASGVFSLRIGSELIYNETISNKSFTIPVKIPDNKYPFIVNKWPAEDYCAYSVTAFYNGIDLNITKSIHFMLNSPDNYRILTVSPEILQYAIDHLMPIQLPYSANGVVKVYVDGKLINYTNATGYWFYYDTTEVTSLGLGNHTMTVQYSNDTYYSPKNVTTSFDVVNVLIDIPDTIYINHDSCVTVKVLNTTKGTVYVFLDGKLVHQEKVDKHGEFLLSLEDYLKWNSSRVDVAFMGDYYRVLAKDINVTYDFGIDYVNPTFEFGKENIIDLWFPDNFNNSLVRLTIDGADYPFVRPDYMANNWVEVDISALGIGNHTLIVSYPGDDRFAPRTETLNFTVAYAIEAPFFGIEFNDSSAFHITLPANANGNLSVYIGDELYKTSKLIDGKASIRVDDLAPNEYVFKAQYTGDDYDVDEITRWCMIGPGVILNSYFTIGSDEYLTLIVPKSCSGSITVRIGDKEFNRSIVNGVAKVSLKNFKIGEYDVDISYSIDGFSKDIWDSFTVVKPKIQLKSLNLYISGVYASIKIVNSNGKAMANQYVTLNVAGKNYKVKTKSNGIATFKLSSKLLAKKYKVSISCNGAKVSKTVLAKKVVSLKAVKIKASAKKLVLSATLKEGKNPIKSKIVTFKFNGKTFKAKTNSKGIAKATVSKSVLKNLKVGKRITYQATYLTDTVKKSGLVFK